MSEHVVLPVWVFAILAMLAGWTVLTLILVPGLRWFFRRRINAAIERVNTRLNIELPQFKLTRRQVLIDRLFHDQRVQEAATSHMRTSGESRAAVLRRIDRYAREIVPSFNAYLYFRIGYAFARVVARTLYRVRVGFVDEEALRRIEPDAAIVFTINHRSNMDYVLVAFLAAERAALSYAVGEWARVWPLQQLLRAMGAYFVRRDSRDSLYRAVLARYVQMATEGGVTQAMFPEGGLSVDGKLRTPKFGLLDYMLRGFDPAGPRDVVFIPVGLNYDRVLEDRTQLLKLERRERGSGRLRGVLTFLAFLARNAGLMVMGRWHRFGYACVNFGAPLSMREYARERGFDFHLLSEAERHAEITKVGALVMDRIMGVIPVLPVSLVASLFVEAPERRFSEFELKAHAHDRLRALEAGGAHLYIPRQDHDYAFTAGLRMLTLRHLVLENDGLFRAASTELDVLRYYANAIAHFTPAPA
jgi:glycerol-3-phosphate O-acyltransferase